MPDGLLPILFVLLWFFIMNRVNAFIKKAREKAQNDQRPVQNKPPEQKFKSLQEILKDLQKQAEAQSGETVREIPPVQKQPPPVVQKVQKPKVYSHRHTVSDYEKKVSDDFRKKVELERMTEHDAEPNIMTEDVYSKVIPDSEPGADFDLRSAIIASIVLERPYS